MGTVWRNPGAPPASCPRCHAALRPDRDFEADQRRAGVREPRQSYICAGGHTVDLFVPTTSTAILGREPDAGLHACVVCGTRFRPKYGSEKFCAACRQIKCRVCSCLGGLHYSSCRSAEARVLKALTAPGGRVRPSASEQAPPGRRVAS